MASLNTMINGPKAATYGWYAQAHSGQTFTGDQLLAVIDDVAASGAIFEPAVMPVGGWKGLSSDDNSQAVNIAKVSRIGQPSVSPHIGLAEPQPLYKRSASLLRS